MSVIISVCSEKGGAGKTTTALNIAGGLAKKGRKVLLIDLDQQGNASSALGFVKDGRPTVSEILYNASAELETDYTSTIRHAETFDYVPSSDMLGGITAFMANGSECNYIMKRILSNKAYAAYDFILIDCRTLLDLLAGNAMNASDYVIIPVECALFSFEGLEKMVGKVSSINGSTNKRLRILGLLMNKHNRTTASNSVIECVRQEYPELTFGEVIPFCPAQCEMAVINRKICAEDDSSTVGKAFMKVVDEILERIA